jgi:hypothetical protein
MKSPIAFTIVAFWIGIISQAFAGPAPVSGGPGGVTTQPVVSGVTSAIDPSRGSTGTAAGAAPNESNPAENDDALYRGKTSESENPMLRDEGALHFKTRPKEKIQEVDSLKKLQSSGSDPKFQGSLLNLDVSSIEKVSGKANDTDNTDDAADEGDPRFKTKRLTFTPDKKDESKQAQSDSSPSPTPSPTTSPAAKNSSKP